ncbi:unnamed protein product, partial [Didymodactylos carnosus]
GSTITTAPSTYSSQCPCEKGERGERGEPGVCPDCSTFPNQIPVSSTTKNILEKTYYFATVQEAMENSFTYPDHTYVHIVNQFGHLDGVFIRISGNLIPISLDSKNFIPMQSFTRPIQSFTRPVQSFTRPVQSFTIPVQSITRPIQSFTRPVQSFTRPVQSITSPVTTLPIPKTKCSDPLPCSELHLFALGPNIRKLCSPNLSSFCTKLSDFDSLCSKVSEQQKLPGFYRAFISSSTQWLSHLFDGICTYAKIVNMQGEILFETIDDIFDGKPSLSYILDLQGYQP